MAAAQAAAVLHSQLTKPAGALGRLEKVGVQLAAIAGCCPPPIPEPVTVAVFAADHGVVAEGVTAWPQEVTAQMVANFCTGGAAINVLARHAGAEVVVVDVGVATPIGADTPGLLRRTVRPGTGNIAVEAAMTPVQARTALDVGADIADQAAGRGTRMLVTGDMGIGNTTASAAVIAAITGLPATAVTGRGAGADNTVLARKVQVVERARRRDPAGADPLLIPRRARRAGDRGAGSPSSAPQRATCRFWSTASSRARRPDRGRPGPRRRGYLIERRAPFRRARGGSRPRSPGSRADA
jgi:nicotinate-nucleotide--dimethylbenzimidazole phosphoribosyltransferase